MPRRKSPLQLAALTAVLLIAFELVLIHWFYLYIPWFFPFVVVALLAPAAAGRAARRRARAARAARPAEAREWPRAALLLAGAWALLHVGVWVAIVITDVPVYEGYGEAIARGEIPTATSGSEYPPGRCPAFAFPTIGKGRPRVRAGCSRG